MNFYRNHLIHQQDLDHINHQLKEQKNLLMWILLEQFAVIKL